MISIQCVGCGSSVTDNSLLVCYSCRDKVRSALSDIGWWFDELLSPPVRARGGPAGKNHARRSPMDDKVGSVRLEILETLLGWANLAFEKTDSTLHAPGILRNDDRYVIGNIDDLIVYLGAQEHWFLTHDAAEGYVPEVIKLAELAQRTGAPNKREGVAIAMHRVEDDLGGLIDCGTVWAKHVNGDGRCSFCGCRKSTAEWHRLYPSLPEDPLTDEEAAAYVTVTYGRTTAASTIAVWRHRGAKADPPQMLPLPRRRLGRIATPRHALDDYITGLRSKIAI